MTGQAFRAGGSFLIGAIPPGEVFTPEDFREEHRMAIDTTEDFVRNEVQPYLERLEHKDFDLTRQLMRQAGQVGLLGAAIEEGYGGSELGEIASLLIDEHLAGAASFGVTMNDHIGIGSLPLIFFGTEAQKRQYLPYLAAGEKIGAYALTEPKAGTDALSIEAKATLSPDGKHYILNGTKQFVTNGGLADIIFTYAKVDGDKFTAFLVEKDIDGVSAGPEEKKMGIRGTSTTSLVFEDVKVPIQNVLFDVGKGHVVAFSVLDLARLRLGAGCLGMAKLSLESSVKYSKERVQFGKPICQFGLIQQKIAEMAIRTYIAESMVYRTGGDIEDTLANVNQGASDTRLRTTEQISRYAIECSINKVYCSEMVGYVADEGVQICGGYGYIEDYLVERVYRDCRIYRIFEGTNEINRLVIVRWLMGKAKRKELALHSAVEKLKDELPRIRPVSSGMDNTPLGYQSQLLEKARKIFAYAFGAATGKYGEALVEEQEVCGALADMAIEIYAMESGLLRALKSIECFGAGSAATKINMVRVYANDAMVRIAGWARQILAAVEQGDILHTQLETLERLSHFIPANVIEVRRKIADRIIEAERFIC